MVQFKDKFIVFIDVLGFTNLVEQSAAGIGVPPSTIVQIQEALNPQGIREEFDRYGPTTCPESQLVDRNLDFRLSSLSDSVLLSAEISPAGIINLTSQASRIAFRLLQVGVMCRGYITRGLLVHTDSHFFGPGLNEAFRQEKQVAAFRRVANEIGTPYVEVSREVCAYVRDCGDACVQRIFSHLTKPDGNIAALFPMKRLSHSFTIGGTHSDPDREKQSNDNVRSMIKKLRTGVLSFVDKSNLKAVTKAEHYVQALDEQLDACDWTDELLDALKQPFLRRTFDDPR
jgi:hypothetical protein